MVKNGEFFVIKEMRQRGMYITHIARELGRDPKTIRKMLEQETPRTYQRQVTRPSKIEAFKEYVQKRMEEGCTNAMVLFDDIKAQGYSGSVTTLRYFMRPLRPIVASKATERFETKPGEQAQVDWGHFRVDWNHTKKQLHAFVMVLGYSRMMYLESTEDEKLETLMGCHERAMDYFGGITDTCLYDNMKTVVAGQDEQGEVIWNEQFAQFAAYHGFILRRCKPYRPRTKGKVENGVGYVRKNFWPRIQSFTGLSDLNAQARLWLDTVANVRIHGTTHEIPMQRWKQENLKAANPIPFYAAVRHIRKVSSDTLVSYQNNRYSMPYAYVGQLIQVQDDKNGLLRFFTQEGIQIAQHLKSTGVHQVITNKKHFEGIRTIGAKQVPQPMPKLVPKTSLEVAERSLAVYEELTDEEVRLQ
ncbi:IS21 family transposase [Paenibacillus turpanensis]|uniref:IS21 family transposase n=1 Tax=Paenibacillus turpanensis TaxID=2689078 RepID=UPI00140D7AA9|nr:IS21 family transposase [Paenibacillus turpanensis]